VHGNAALKRTFKSFKLKSLCLVPCARFMKHRQPSISLQPLHAQLFT